MYMQWIDSVLPSPLAGPIEVTKERPWSLVAKVPTEAGLLWFKENRAGTVYEAGLMQALYEWVPDRILKPVAVDAERGWSLLPDGGPILREADEKPDKAHWQELLAQHAQLQRDLAGKADEMLALGVPDMRPARIIELAGDLPVPDAYRPTLRELCEQLRQSPVPASLQHDDLRDGNVFKSGRIFDWGDASVAHPFGVLLVSLRVASDKFEVEPGDPLLTDLRDAYLEPWSDLAPRDQLLRDVDVAIQVTKVSRALSWQRALLTPEAIAEYEDPVSAWLQELLSDSPH